VRRWLSGGHLGDYFGGFSVGEMPWLLLVFLSLFSISLLTRIAGIHRHFSVVVLSSSLEIPRGFGYSWDRGVVEHCAYFGLYNMESL
jgi:hypothetical protein